MSERKKKPSERPLWRSRQKPSPEQQAEETKDRLHILECNRANIIKARGMILQEGYGDHVILIANMDFWAGRDIGEGMLGKAACHEQIDRIKAQGLSPNLILSAPREAMASALNGFIEGAGDRFLKLPVPAGEYEIVVLAAGGHSVARMRDDLDDMRPYEGAI